MKMILFDFAHIFHCSRSTARINGEMKRVPGFAVHASGYDFGKKP